MADVKIYKSRYSVYILLRALALNISEMFDPRNVRVQFFAMPFDGKYQNLQKAFMHFYASSNRLDILAIFAHRETYNAVKLPIRLKKSYANNKKKHLKYFY